MPIHKILKSIALKGEWVTHATQGASEAGATLGFGSGLLAGVIAVGGALEQKAPPQQKVAMAAGVITGGAGVGYCLGSQRIPSLMSLCKGLLRPLMLWQLLLSVVQYIMRTKNQRLLRVPTSQEDSV